MHSSNLVEVENLSYSFAVKRATHASDQICSEGLSRVTALIVPRLWISQNELIVVCGANGAGKSTFLSIMGGRKLVPAKTVLVLGRECFNDCTLSSSVCYLGDWWRTDFFLDTPVRDFLGPMTCEKDSCKELVDILQVNLDWRISQLSDGQRRRCQILAGLTASDGYKLYILDEVTADLDIVVRERLLAWLKLQARRRACSTILATHIMDGINEWATRLIFMEHGSVKYDVPVNEDVAVYPMLRRWMIQSYGASEL